MISEGLRRNKALTELSLYSEENRKTDNILLNEEGKKGT